MTTGNSMQNDGVGREELARKVEDVRERIEAYNGHWLNHKHLVSAFGVLIMAFIFTGMLFRSIEDVMWLLCGVCLFALVTVMLWRSRLAGRLNAEMAEAQAALKAHERERKRKRR